MLVVVVCECEKQARIRSRRIVSKYLPQIASSTWLGTLSKEGIRELQEALLKVASKNTAISCFICKSSRRSELVWQVGQKSKWTETGWFNFKTTAIDISE